MGMFATLRDWFGAVDDPAIVTRDMTPPALRDSAGAAIIPWHNNTPQWPQRTPATYVTEGWQKAPVVFACVSTLADAAATAPIRVMEAMGGGQAEPVDNDLSRLLARPNPGMGQAGFVAHVVTMAALAGFCVVEKERAVNGQVIGLWPLRSDWVRPVPRQQSDPAWEYRVPGYTQPFLLEPEDVVVHRHAPDPAGGYTGTAPMAVALRELGVENAMTDFLKAFFDRGALPVYGIIPKERAAIRSQEQADSFIDRLLGKYGGAHRSVRPMLLTGVEDVKRLGFDFDEMAYPELRALSEVAICNSFRVPPVLVGVQAGLDSSTYSNYETARRTYYEDVITALWRRLDGALTRSLVPDFDATGRLQVSFDTGDVPALRTNEQELWQRATAALSAGGISTHVFQRMVNLDPHGPDVIYQPFSATPVPVSSGQRSLATITLVGEPGPEIAHLPPGQRLVTRDGRTYLRWNAISDIEQRTLTRAAQHNRDMTLKFAGMLEPRMVTFFAEQGQRVVAALEGRADEPGLETRALEDADWDSEAQRLRALIEQWFAEAGDAMFTEIAQQLGSDIAWQRGNQYVSELYEQLGTRIVGMHETTRQRVQQVIVDGLEAGKSIPQLADDLHATFDGFSETRAVTIARTESQYAANTTAALAYQESGIEKALLLDNPNHTTDPGSDGLTCAERNNLVVSVRDVPRHAGGTHPNCVLACAPLLPEAGV